MSPEGLAQVLSRVDRVVDDNLLVGYAGADDAAVYKIDDERVIVVTTDFFPPMVDDPFTFGQVAAANALSDVYAMGARPLVALNLVGFPSTLPGEILSDILNGGASKVREARAVVGGGHTVEDNEIKYGLAVTGEGRIDRVWRNGGVRVGDVILLTKPIGMGLINSAVKVDGDDGPAVKEAIRWMTTLNGVGIEHLYAADIGGVTDITGFGLLGHARELVDGSPATLLIRASTVPLIAGARDYCKKKYKTRSARQTREYTAGQVVLDERIDEWTDELLFDPQTSGGLLVALRADQADQVVKRLRESGLEATAIIGEAVPREGDVRVRVAP